MSKDLMPGDTYTPGKGQFLIYEAEDGQVKIDEGEGSGIRRGSDP